MHLGVVALVTWPCRRRLVLWLDSAGTCSRRSRQYDPLGKVVKVHAYVPNVDGIQGSLPP